MEERSMNSIDGTFTYSQIADITSNFKTVIGEGGFGKVYLGTLNENNDVAVKVLSPSSTQGYKEFQAEVKLLKIVHHKNLVSLVGYCDEDGNKALIYEYVANGNLNRHLSEKSRKILSWNARLQIAVDIANGLEYLHNCKPPMIHGALKPPNILLSEDMQAKIADYGLSRAFTIEPNLHISTCPLGTFGYLDLESCTTRHISNKSDVYSFGVILLQLVSGQPAVITRGSEENIHITNWMSPLFKKGDIKSIIDPRLQGEIDINEAWKVMKIAMSCVLPIRKRPDMSHVLAQLKTTTNMKEMEETCGFTNVLARICEIISRDKKASDLLSSSSANSQNISYEAEFRNKPSFKVYCKTNPKFSLIIREGRVILARTNPSDPLQHWYKDEKYGSAVRDEEGVPSFALVNKATGQAIKHSTEADLPVQLVSHDPEKVDKSMLWTESLDSDSGYKSIRMVTNTNLCLDARYGRVVDGTHVILYSRNFADNQWWKIEKHSQKAMRITLSCVLPIQKRPEVSHGARIHKIMRRCRKASAPVFASSANFKKISYEVDFSNSPSFKVYCKTKPKFSFTIREGRVILAPTNPSDPLQHWYKDEKYGSAVKDEEGVPSFALVNKATGQAIKHSIKADLPVQLVSYDSKKVDKSVLWTESLDSDSGYKSIRMVTNTNLCIDARYGRVRDGTYIILYPRNYADNQWWKIEQHSPSSDKLLNLRNVWPWRCLPNKLRGMRSNMEDSGNAD